MTHKYFIPILSGPKSPLLLPSLSWKWIPRRRVQFLWNFHTTQCFKALSLPGKSHSLGSRHYLVLLTCWYSVRSHSPPCTPLATRSHVYSYHTTHIHLFCWQYTTVFSTCPAVQPVEILRILCDSFQKFLRRSRIKEWQVQPSMFQHKSFSCRWLYILYRNSEWHWQIKIPFAD